MDTITQPLPKTSTTKDSRAVEPSAGDDSDVLYIVAPAYNINYPDPKGIGVCRTPIGSQRV